MTRIFRSLLNTEARPALWTMFFLVSALCCSLPHLAVAIVQGVSGYVLGYNGQPLEGVAVRAYAVTDLDHPVGEEGTDASGFYQIALSNGTYKMRALPAINTMWPNERYNFYRSEWYDNAANGDAAATVTVVTSNNTPDIDFNLDHYPGISGVISNTAGERMSYVYVHLHGVSTGATPFVSYWANEWGEYLFNSIRPGDYKVEVDTTLNAFYPNDTYRHLRPEYYNDRDFYTQADMVSLAVSANVYNVDFELTPYGLITGHVFEAGSGTPIEGVHISANNTTGDQFGWLSYDSDSNGAYRIYGVAGAYRLHADAGSQPYVPQYYSNKADQGSADLIPLQMDQVVSNIDFHMTKFTAGSISGYVRRPDGSPASATVSAYGDSDSGSDGTSGSGYYQITGLQEGDYWLRTQIYGYPDLYYCQQYSQNNKHYVHVTPGQDSGGIDLQFREGGTVYGTITDPAGLPLKGMPVKLWHLNGPGGSDTSDVNGYYEMTHVAPGLVRIYADPTDTSDPNITPYILEYYNDAFDEPSAERLVIEDGETNGPVNIQMNLGGKVTGTLTIPGESPNNVRVRIWSVGNSGKYYGYAECESDGTYVLTGILPGDYTVCGENKNGMVSPWYDGKVAEGEADVLTIVGTETISNVNLTYTEGNTISGKITAQGTSTGIREAFVRPFSTNGYLVGRTGQAWTESDGTYSLTELPPGTFKLAVSPHYSNAEYGGTRAYEFYGGTRDFSAATEIVLGEGVDLTGINVGLDTVSGTLAGTVVRDVDSTPLVDKYVELVVADLPDVFVGEVKTDANGDYTMVGIPAGSYHSYYYQDSDNVFHDQYYDLKASAATADAIVTSAGNTTTGIDFRMQYQLPNHSPNILAPLSSSAANPPTFEWTEVAEMARYELKVDDVTAMTDDVIREVVADLTYTPTNTLVSSHQYESRVRCGDVGAWGPWSSPVPFEQLPPPNYALDVTVSGDGHVDLDPVGGSYPAGSVVGLAAVEDNGSNFDSWSAGVSNRFVANTSIVMNGDRDVTVYFLPNMAPFAPLNLSPSNSAFHVSLAPVLISSMMNDPDFDTHVLSQWQIRETTGTYNAPIYNSGLSTSLTELLVSPGYLTYTSYWWRVQHRDEYGASSPWSSETLFDTTPTIDDVIPAGSNSVVSFPTSLGYLYTLQYIEDLVSGTWSNVPGMINIPGNNGYLLYTNTIPFDDGILFRTLVNPAP